MFKDQKKRTGDLVTLFGHNSSLAEQFRTLRTNISFAKAGGGMKALLVTSAEAGDGKSTTAANLAIVTAQQGKQVLLIDADIRKPTQHYLFQTSNARGLTNLLTGQADFREVVQITGVDGLSLLTSGPVSPNPADLLSSEEMKDVMDQAEGQFDQVIIDSPPVLAVADARLLANLCDGIVFVVRSKSTEIDQVTRSVAALSEANGKLLGVVLNDKKENRKDHYGYYESASSLL